MGVKVIFKTFDKNCYPLIKCKNVSMRCFEINRAILEISAHFKKLRAVDLKSAHLFISGSDKPPSTPPRPGGPRLERYEYKLACSVWIGGYQLF